jgi:hypothetical protein
MADNLTAQIAREIFIALERLDADEQLLAIIGSWEDTAADDEILVLLKNYNGTDKKSEMRQ